MISLLLLRAMFSWEEYSHGKHRLLDMCRYMFVCYQTFPGAFLGKFQVQYQVYVAWYTAQYFYMQVQQLTFPKYIHFHEMTPSPLVLVRLLSSSRLSVVVAYPAVS